jgi:hypothetical protein
MGQQLDSTCTQPHLAPRRDVQGGDARVVRVDDADVAGAGAGEELPLGPRHALEVPPHPLQVHGRDVGDDPDGRAAYLSQKRDLAKAAHAQLDVAVHKLHLKKQILKNQDITLQVFKG